MNAYGKRMGWLALAVLLSSVRPTLASETVTVPFRAMGSPASVELGPGGTLQIMAQGHATHLGAYTAFAEITPIRPQGPGELPQFDGVITMLAANGDELHFHYAGVFTQVVPIIEGVGSYDITGGTGRFEGASGQGAFSIHDNMTTFDGTISLSVGR